MASPPLRNEACHVLAVNAADSDTSVAINRVVLATIAANIAMSNKLSEPITRFKSTRPHCTCFIEAHLVRFRRVYSI